MGSLLMTSSKRCVDNQLNNLSTNCFLMHAAHRCTISSFHSDFCFQRLSSTTWACFALMRIIRPGWDKFRPACLETILALRGEDICIPVHSREGLAHEANSQLHEPLRSVQHCRISSQAWFAFAWPAWVSIIVPYSNEYNSEVATHLTQWYRTNSPQSSHLFAHREQGKHLLSRVLPSTRADPSSTCLCHASPPKHWPYVHILFQPEKGRR